MELSLSVRRNTKSKSYNVDSAFNLMFTYVVNDKVFAQMFLNIYSK